MRTARLPTIHVLVATTRGQYQWGSVGIQVNRFEKVSSDGHQMTAAGDRCPGPHVWGRGDGEGGGEGYPTILHLMSTTYPPPL